jgi:hypothetical protein
MQADYEEKLAKALSLLENSGLKPGSYAPPLFRLARRLGLKVRPPHFAPGLENLLYNGFLVGAIFVLIPLALRPGHYRFQPLWILESALAGMVYGIAIAIGYARAARSHKLPSWTQLD